MQSNYVNGAVLKELISNDQVTTIYQNGERFRAGKLYKKQSADMSIRWILEAFTSLQAEGRNLMIVPVMISYDRIYESLNLATEMINGKKNDYNFFTSSKMIWSTEHNSLGHIYVKYLEPINLDKFLGAKV